MVVGDGKDDLRQKYVKEKGKFGTDKRVKGQKGKRVKDVKDINISEVVC